MKTLLRVVGCLVLGGCASMSGPPPDLPVAQASIALPNCVLWCHVIVHASKADSDIQSEGTGAVTGATQTLSGESSQTSSKTRSTDVPIPPL